MSERNGDKARFHKNRKRRLRQRQRTPALLRKTAAASAHVAADTHNASDTATSGDAGTGAASRRTRDKDHRASNSSA
jgi:hypothetical protein